MHAPNSAADAPRAIGHIMASKSSSISERRHTRRRTIEQVSARPKAVREDPHCHSSQEFVFMPKGKEILLMPSPSTLRWPALCMAPTHRKVDSARITSDACRRNFDLGRIADQHLEKIRQFASTKTGDCRNPVRPKWPQNTLTNSSSHAAQ